MTVDGVRDAEERFFGALLAADQAALDAVLAPDFTLVDVLAGQLVPRHLLLDLVGTRELEFLDIARDTGAASVRHRPGVAVVVGRTRMTMRTKDGQFTVYSRYAHVYVADQEHWLLIAAHGTQEGNPR